MNTQTYTFSRLEHPPKISVVEPVPRNEQEIICTQNAIMEGISKMHMLLHNILHYWKIHEHPILLLQQLDQMSRISMQTDTVVPLMINSAQYNKQASQTIQIDREESQNVVLTHKIW